MLSRPSESSLATLRQDVPNGRFDAITCDLQDFQMRSAEVGERLIRIYRSLPPEPRQAAGDVLLYRKENHQALVGADEQIT